MSYGIKYKPYGAKKWRVAKTPTKQKPYAFKTKKEAVKRFKPFTKTGKRSKFAPYTEDRKWKVFKLKKKR